MTRSGDPTKRRATVAAALLHRVDFPHGLVVEDDPTAAGYMDRDPDLVLVAIEQDLTERSLLPDLATGTTSGTVCALGPTLVWARRKFLRERVEVAISCDHVATVCSTSAAIRHKEAVLGRAEQGRKEVERRVNAFFDDVESRGVVDLYVIGPSGISAYADVMGDIEQSAYPASSWRLLGSIEHEDLLPTAREGSPCMH
jgi:hypothetical protein